MHKEAVIPRVESYDRLLTSVGDDPHRGELHLPIA